MASGWSLPDSENTKAAAMFKVEMWKTLRQFPPQFVDTKIAQ